MDGLEYSAALATAHAPLGQRAAAVVTALGGIPPVALLDAGETLRRACAELPLSVTSTSDPAVNAVDRAHYDMRLRVGSRIAGAAAFLIGLSIAAVFAVPHFEGGKIILSGYHQPERAFSVFDHAIRQFFF